MHWVTCEHIVQFHSSTPYHGTSLHPLKKILKYWWTGVLGLNPKLPVQCGVVITRSIFLEISTKEVWAKSFVNPASGCFYASVPAIINAVPNYIGPCYNGTRLYFDLYLYFRAASMLLKRERKPVQRGGNRVIHVHAAFPPSRLAPENAVVLGRWNQLKSSEMDEWNHGPVHCFVRDGTGI